MILRVTILISTLLGTTSVVLATDDTPRVTRTTDPESGLLAWHWEAGQLSLDLVQRLPDQTRAFFQARGFTSDSADAVARECVFQTIIRNTGANPAAGALEVDLSQWRVQVGSRQQPLKLRQDWDQELTRRSVSEPARIAFQWSVFPTRQRFEPGDYNWGMTVYGLPPETSFDLRLVWHVRGSNQSGILRDLACPPDIHLQAGGS